jgi:hypothetical protein
LDQIALIFWIIRVSGFPAKFEQAVKFSENRRKVVRNLPMILGGIPRAAAMLNNCSTREGDRKQ